MTEERGTAVIVGLPHTMLTVDNQNLKKLPQEEGARRGVIPALQGGAQRSEVSRDANR